MEKLLDSYKKIIALVVYLIINSFFILKYSIRQEYFSTLSIFLIYNILVVIGIYLIYFFRDFISKVKKVNYYFLAVCILIFVVFVLVNVFIDGNTLNSDRWSAMHTTINGVLNGNYPYSLKDHLGQTSSNLPGLFFIGLPFYLIGNVSLLQPFIFLVTSLLLFKSKLEMYKKAIIVFLLIVSPAYLWEIFAKSDLLSNIFILVFFIILWDIKFKLNYFKYPFLLSFFIAFLVLTRGIVVIPLTLFLFSSFIKSSNKAKLKFSIGFLINMVLISFPFLITLPEIEVIKEHNPFNHQTRFTPKWVQITFIILPFIFGVRIKKIHQVIFQSLLFLTLLLFLSFILEIIDEGYKNTLHNSSFDISYLTMILPFSILYFITNTKKLDLNYF